MTFEGREYDLHSASRREIAEIRSHTGFVFQNYNLFANKTALENVTLGLTVTGKKTKAEADRIGLDLLEKVGMGNRFSYYPSQLSGGQQQRVGIARALAAGPDILYLDEPTSALDPELIGEVMEVLRLLAKSSVTMVIVTHEMRFAREVSSKVVFMDKGKVVEQADPETFFTAPEKVSLAAAALAAGVLAGCGQSGTAGASSTAAASESTASAGESTQEAAASGDHLSRIKAAGVITVATEGDWAPFTYHDEATNDLVGFDVETAQEIAKRLGVTAEFKEGDFDGGLTGVSQGTFDMMANGVDVTQERSQTFDFTDPYAYDHAVIVTKADNDTIHSFADLKGLTTANSVGSTYAEMGSENGANVTNVPTLAETMELVLNGTADATINANTSVQDYFKTSGTEELKVAATDDQVTEYAIPLKKGSDNDSLREAINKAIAQMKEDGTLTKISEKYFGSDITKE